MNKHEMKRREKMKEKKQLYLALYLANEAKLV